MKLTREFYLGTRFKPVLVNPQWEIHTAEIQSKDAFEVMGFWGKRSKPEFHVKVAKKALVDYIQLKASNFDQSVATTAEWKEKRKSDSARHRDEFLAKLSPGVILVNSWGYEQTNVDFYQIISVSGRKVRFQRIASRTVRETGWASGTCVACPNEFIGEVRETIVRGAGLKLNDWDSVCTFWDGNEEHYSSYH